MFSEFQDLFKKTKLMPSSNDYSKTPQKFRINGREILQKKLLSEGAFGFIWLAEDVNTKQQFALKRVICMTKLALKAAVTEKQIYQKLPKSPHIVGYYGGNVFKYEEKTVVVTLMELCSNGNLFDMLEKHEGKGLSEQMIKKIAESVLKGLILLHQAGFIHRDIKIQNVLIGKDNQMKICDFGSCTNQIVDFSKIDKDNYQIEQQKIQSYTTPMYRPPQVVDPYLKYSVTSKMDLWMLGCVLYTMSYFNHPFVESNAVGIASGVFKFPQYPTETKYNVSVKVQDFIRNLLTPNPNSRPSAQKMLELLNRWTEYQNVPLNRQAKKLKEQHLKQEKQIQKFHTKVVQHDGDIPIEQLMKLKNKMMEETAQEQSQGKSFITKKNKKNVELSNLKDKNSQNAKQNIAKPVQETSPSKLKSHPSKEIDFDPWTLSPVQKSQKVQNDLNFSQFSNITDTKKSTKSNPKNQSIPQTNNNFMQFFLQTYKQPNKQAQIPNPTSTKTNQSNDLLDL